MPLVRCRLLIEEIKACQLKRQEEQEKLRQREITRDLPAIRIFDIPSSPSKQLIFARYNNWVMVPWFSISTLFEPPLAESTIERFVGLCWRFSFALRSDTSFISQAMLFKFSPVHLTPLTNGLLCARLQKCLAEAKQTSISL